MNLNETEKISRVYADYRVRAIAIGIAVWTWRNCSSKKPAVRGRGIPLSREEFGHFEVIAVAELHFDEYGVLVVGLFILAFTEWSTCIVVLIL